MTQSVCTPSTNIPQSPRPFSCFTLPSSLWGPGAPLMLSRGLQSLSLSPCHLGTSSPAEGSCLFVSPDCTWERMWTKASDSRRPTQPEEERTTPEGGLWPWRMTKSRICWWPRDEGCLEGSHVNRLPREPKSGPSFKSLSQGLHVWRLGSVPISEVSLWWSKRGWESETNCPTGAYMWGRGLEGLLSPEWILPSRDWGKKEKTLRAQGPQLVKAQPSGLCGWGVLHGSPAEFCTVPS